MNVLRVAMIALPLASTASTMPAQTATPVADGWLMLVATRCTDPAREVEFNRWYDDIDIPDVLEVPGYNRARRGVRTQTDGVAPDPLDAGRYVALYDIESRNLDKTIIEMLMATRKMEMRGRSTELLKVVERVYYHQYSPAQAAGQADTTGGREYFLLERPECCRDSAAEKGFNEWYDLTHVTEALKIGGIARVTRYELDRVLMVEPVQASKYLTVYEMRADSPEAAMDISRGLIDKLGASLRAKGYGVDGGSTLYLKITDVKD